MKLRLLVVAMAKCSHVVSDFFLSSLSYCELVDASCKGKDMFRQRHYELTLKCLESGEIFSGKKEESRNLFNSTGRYTVGFTSYNNISSLFDVTISNKTA